MPDSCPDCGFDESADEKHDCPGPRAGSASTGRTLDLRFEPADLLPEAYRLEASADDELADSMMTRLRDAAVERELAPAAESVRAQARYDVHSAVMAMLEDGTTDYTIECFSHTLHVR